MTVHTELQDSHTVNTRASEALIGGDGMSHAKQPPSHHPIMMDDNDLMGPIHKCNHYVRIIKPSWRCNSDTDSHSDASSGSASTDTRGRRRFYRRRRRPTTPSVVVATHQRIELEVDGPGGLKALLDLELAVKHNHYQHSVSSLSSFYGDDSDSEDCPTRHTFLLSEHREIPCPRISHHPAMAPPR